MIGFTNLLSLSLNSLTALYTSDIPSQGELVPHISVGNGEGWGSSLRLRCATVGSYRGIIDQGDSSEVLNVPDEVR